MELKRNRQFGKIGVLIGGPSSEREISLKSGKAVYDSLSAAGFDAVAIDIRSENIKDNIHLLRSSGIDCAFIALHGRFGEDGQMQQMLDNLNIPYTGSGTMASRLAMDKVASRVLFQGRGLNVPLCKVAAKGVSLEELNDRNMSWPLVVKPAAQGSSIGLSIIDKQELLAEAMSLAFSFDERVLIEEYIKGRELTVGILDEQPLPVVEIIPKNKFFDYEAKYKKGMTDYEVPANLDETLAHKIKDAGLSAHQSLGCRGCSRVDIILDQSNRPFVLEVNTIPGLTETSLLPKAASRAGIGFLDLCLTLIKLAYAKTKE